MKARVVVIVIAGTTSFRNISEARVSSTGRRRLEEHKSPTWLRRQPFTATATVGEENSTHPTTKSRETEVEKDIRVGNASKGGGKRAAAAAADDDGSKS